MEATATSRLPTGTASDVFFDDGVMRAQMLTQGWVFLYWVNNTLGRLPVKLVKDLRHLEKMIRLKGWTGWVCNSEKEHLQTHKLLKRVGAEVYDEDPKYLFFKKEINHVR
jgi:hypothetical protein